MNTLRECVIGATDDVLPESLASNGGDHFVCALVRGRETVGGILTERVTQQLNQNRVAGRARGYDLYARAYPLGVRADGSVVEPGELVGQVEALFQGLRTDQDSFFA